MNLANVQYTIDLMESPKVKDRFNMVVFFTGGKEKTCGTKACLAGWLHWEGKINLDTANVGHHVGKFLGISNNLARRLCYLVTSYGEQAREFYGQSMSSITSQMVADKLRELRDEYLLEHEFEDIIAHRSAINNEVISQFNSLPQRVSDLNHEVIAM